MADPLLSLKNVQAGYGESIVLDGISLDIEEDGSRCSAAMASASRPCC